MYMVIMYTVERKIQNLPKYFFMFLFPHVFIPLEKSEFFFCKKLDFS